MKLRSLHESTTLSPPPGCFPPEVVTKKAAIPCQFDTHIWLPHESCEEERECSYPSCRNVFPLKDGYTYPLKYVRSVVHGIPIVSMYPLMVFCSLEHLLMPAMAIDNVVSLKGNVIRVEH